jgi:hypothetical protein
VSNLSEQQRGRASKIGLLRKGSSLHHAMARSLAENRHD